MGRDGGAARSRSNTHPVASRDGRPRGRSVRARSRVSMAVASSPRTRAPRRATPPHDRGTTSARLSEGARRAPSPSFGRGRDVFAPPTDREARSVAGERRPRSSPARRGGAPDLPGPARAREGGLEDRPSGASRRATPGAPRRGRGASRRGPFGVAPRGAPGCDRDCSDRALRVSESGCLGRASEVLPDVLPVLPDFGPDVRELGDEGLPPLPFPPASAL